MQPYSLIFWSAFPVCAQPFQRVPEHGSTYAIGTLEPIWNVTHMWSCEFLFRGECWLTVCTQIHYLPGWSCMLRANHEDRLLVFQSILWPTSVHVFHPMYHWVAAVCLPKWVRPGLEIKWFQRVFWIELFNTCVHQEKYNLNVNIMSSVSPKQTITP